MAKIIHEFGQRSAMWERIRCGRLTASNLSKILTPAQKKFSEQCRDFAFTVAAERIKGRTEDGFSNADIERGIELEDEARYQYNKHFAPVREVGFIENNDYGFQFGASPDGLLINENGAIEIKSPQAKGHLKTIIDGDIAGTYDMQMQGLMLAGDLDFVDFVSYNEGLIIKPIRVMRNNETIVKIIEAGKRFEEMVENIIADYRNIEKQNNTVKTKIPAEVI
jgi:hypothetical protein